MLETSSETTCTESDFSDLYKEEEGYWWSAARRRLVSRFLWKYSPSQNPRVIDIGCGGGGFLGSLKGKAKVFGLEHSSIGASITEARIKGRAVRGDAGQLPFKDRSFDILTSLDVIEHLDDDVSALEGFHCVLSEEGIIVLTVPALNILWSPRDRLLGHKRRYTVKGLTLLLKKTGFDVMKCSYTNSFYFPGLLVYSLLKRIFDQEGRPKKLILSLPQCLSKTFEWILSIEERILMHANLPIGTSIICVAKKGPNL